MLPPYYCAMCPVEPMYVICSPRNLEAERKKSTIESRKKLCRCWAYFKFFAYGTMTSKWVLFFHSAAVRLHCVCNLTPIRIGCIFLLLSSAFFLSFLPYLFFSSLFIPFPPFFNLRIDRHGPCCIFVQPSSLKRPCKAARSQKADLSWA
jgi:hypothetical protein